MGAGSAELVDDHVGSGEQGVERGVVGAERDHLLARVPRPRDVAGERVARGRHHSYHVGAEVAEHAVARADGSPPRSRTRNPSSSRCAMPKPFRENLTGASVYASVREAIFGPAPCPASPTRTDDPSARRECRSHNAERGAAQDQDQRVRSSRVLPGRCRRRLPRDRVGQRGPRRARRPARPRGRSTGQDDCGQHHRPAATWRGSGRGRGVGHGDVRRTGWCRLGPPGMVLVGADEGGDGPWRAEGPTSRLTPTSG